MLYRDVAIPIDVFCDLLFRLDTVSGSHIVWTDNHAGVLFDNNFDRDPLPNTGFLSCRIVGMPGNLATTSNQ
jgi:hypothetical protein